MNPKVNYVDLSYLEEFTRGDEQKLRRYLDMYLRTAPPVIKEFHHLLQKQNLDDLQLKAHSIKPQAQYLGIAALHDVLIEIESIIRYHGNKDKLPLLIAEADRIGKAAEAEINSFLTR
jgi:HPt (histidine-containing phosphotransfer) domain-containing protein